MMTFSTSSGTCRLAFGCYFTLYSSPLGGRSSPRWRGRGAAALSLFPPASDSTPELEEREGARDRRQPEGERPVREHRDDRQAAVHAERDECADHAAVDAAHAAGDREQI